MTFVPIDVAMWGAPIGVLCLIYCFSKSGRRSLSRRIGSFALVVLGIILIGGAAGAAIVKINYYHRQVYEAAFAELPVEWMDFYDGLNKLTSERLQLEAIARFARTDQPRITIRQHSALVGSGFPRPTLAMKTIENSPQIDQFVILDFVDGSCQMIGEAE